jgi:hypothetical protein
VEVNVDEKTKPATIGVIVPPEVKRAFADEAWRRRTTQSSLARELLLDGLRLRGVEIEVSEEVRG